MRHPAKTEDDFNVDGLIEVAWEIAKEEDAKLRQLCDDVLAEESIGKRYEPSSPEGLLETALRIAGERRAALKEIRARLVSGNDQEALRLMRLYLSIGVEKRPSNRKRKNRE